MAWWGKVLGGAFGFMLGGPLGALLGATLGHGFDRGLKELDEHGPALGNTERVQTAFFTATFSVMGHMAKIDGRVTEDEITTARSIMAQMQLTDAQRETAIRLFREGKSARFDVDAVLEQFRQECFRRRNLIQMFLEIQIATALSDGAISSAERQALRLMCDRLGFPESRLEQLVALAIAFQSGRFGHRNGAERTAPAAQVSLSADYALLGVDENASQAEVKKAYRRLMAQHHPDKLVAKGLPEEMIRLATERTQEIKAAYERVKAARAT